MSKQPSLQYSMTEVREAGRKLAGKIDYEPENRAETAHAFRVANAFRDAHILPTFSVRAFVRMQMRQGQVAGDMASRPKRMPSVRRKLSAMKDLELDKMQDLGGCRAILDDIDGVNTLLERFRERSPHRIRKESAYIQKPKDDGYRSHHFMLLFEPTKKEHESYAGRAVELQVRTRLQHSWATAIEAVGLYRNQDLKHHKGDADWLRLFELASAEFAHVERCALPRGMPDRAERIRELKDLNDRLGAVSTLQNIQSATHYAENFVHERGRYYLLRYQTDHRVKIETYYSTDSATLALRLAEKAVDTGESDEKVVLVQVDKIDKLVQTYPNYFGDVSLFIRNLELACKGRPGIEYTVAPQDVVRPREVENPDWGALHRRYTRDRAEAVGMESGRRSSSPLW